MIEIDGERALATLLAGPDVVSIKRSRQDAQPAKHPIILDIPIALKRAGTGMKLVVPGARNNAKCAPGLIRLLLRAFAIQDRFGAKPRSHPAADRRGRRRLTFLCHPGTASCLPCPGHRHGNHRRSATAWADREHAHEEHPPAVQVGSPAKAAWVQARLTSGPSQAGRFCRWMQVVESCVNRFGRRKDGPLKRA